MNVFPLLVFSNKGKGRLDAFEGGDAEVRCGHVVLEESGVLVDCEGTKKERRVNRSI
jgi:hypothetical protein